MSLGSPVAIDWYCWAFGVTFFSIFRRPVWENNFSIYFFVAVKLIDTFVFFIFGVSISQLWHAICMNLVGGFQWLLKNKYRHFRMNSISISFLLIIGVIKYWLLLLCFLFRLSYQKFENKAIFVKLDTLHMNSGLSFVLLGFVCVCVCCFLPFLMLASGVNDVFFARVIGYLEDKFTLKTVCVCVCVKVVDVITIRPPQQ